MVYELFVCSEKLPLLSNAVMCPDQSSSAPQASARPSTRRTPLQLLLVVLLQLCARSAHAAVCSTTDTGSWFYPGWSLYNLLQVQPGGSNPLFSGCTNTSAPTLATDGNLTLASFYDVAAQAEVVQSNGLYTW